MWLTFADYPSAFGGLPEVVGNQHWLVYTASKVGKYRTITKDECFSIREKDTCRPSQLILALPEIYGGDIFHRRC